MSFWGNGWSECLFNCFFSFPPLHLIVENTRRLCGATSEQIQGLCFVCYVFALLYTLCFVFSSSGLETVFLAFVADKNQLCFWEGCVGGGDSLFCFLCCGE